MKDNTATSEQTAQALSALLTRLDHSQAETLSATAASATVFSAGSPQLLGDLVMLLPLARPLECRLPTRDLVELLKMPTCTGATQRVILDHLGNRYHRTFRHLWQFVDYALEHKLEADLTTPPRRFEPDRVPGKR